MTAIALGLAGILLGAGAVLLLKKKIFAGEYRQVDLYHQQLEARTREEAERAKKQSQLELKEEFAEWKNEYNRRQNEKVNRLNVMEKRLILKEENLDKRYANLDNKEKELKKKERDLALQEEEDAALKKQVEQLYEEQRLKLEKISGLTVQEAKEMIIRQYEAQADRGGAEGEEPADGQGGDLQRRAAHRHRARGLLLGHGHRPAVG
jgi:ribonuclease Y